MKIHNKIIACAVTIFAVSSSLAAYPDKPIKLVVPFAAGGPTDVVARSLADALGRTLGTAVIVENKPGAGGAIGSAQVSRAEPDGYTLGVAAVSTHVVNPACNANIQYDPVKDFTPISLVADMPMIWAMQPKMVEGNLQDVIKTAKAAPGKLTQGTAGTCTLMHMMVDKINDRLDVNIQSVPYQGSAPALNDFLGSNLDLLLDVAYIVQPVVNSGRAKPFAVISSQRLEALPDTPTIDELGYKELNFRPWYGIVGPKDLPNEVTQKLIVAIKTSMEDKRLQDQFKKSGMNPISGVDGKDFSEKISREFIDNKPFAAKTNKN